MLYNAKVQANLSQEATMSFDLIETEVNILALKNKSRFINIDENLINYDKLVKVYRQFKDQQLTFSQRILNKIQNQNTLSGDELYLIKRGFDLFYKMNSEMLTFGDMYKSRPGTWAKNLSRKSNKTAYVKGRMIWLNSHLLTLDHLQKIHSVLYEQEDDLRRILKNILKDNLVDTETKRKIKELTEQINTMVEIGESSKFAQQINLIHAIAPDLQKEFSEDPIMLSLIDDVLINMTALEIVRGRSDFKISTFGLEDSLVTFFSKVTNFLSGFFGNIAGSIKWRTGYFFDNKTVLDLTKKDLQPLDILFEKSPFVLTDKFIPGHYGHVALYLGTQTQLEAIGMWDHPSIVPYQEQIASGFIILEAVRPGVRLTTLENFLNIDELTVVRKKDALDSPEIIREQITRGFEQIGKSYDFNFDISTLDKIVCSELIYIIYGHVNWTTRYRVDRPTVTPDDLGEILFMKNTRFNISQYLLSTKRQNLEMPTIERLASLYDYEKRSENGTEIKDPDDPTNSYWKKETKCYTVSNDSNPFKRECSTSYKEFYYEESGT